MLIRLTYLLMVRLFCWPAVPAAVPRRLPNGKTVLEQFLASWPDLSAADRDLLRGWRDPVDRIFVIRGRDADSLILAPEGPQCWVRGVLRVRGREITVEVNSQQRLARLLGILRKVGADPMVASEKRIDPADFAWAAGQRASPGGARG